MHCADYNTALHCINAAIAVRNDRNQLCVPTPVIVLPQKNPGCVSLSLHLFFFSQGFPGRDGTPGAPGRPGGPGPPGVPVSVEPVARPLGERSLWNDECFCVCVYLSERGFQSCL